MSIILGRLFQFFVVFVSYRVALGLFSPSEYGSLSVFFVISSFFILVSISPFGSYLLANCVRWKREKSLFQRIKLIFLISIFFGFLFFTLFWLIYFYVFQIDHHLIFIGFHVSGSALIQTLISVIGIIYSIRSAIFIANLNAIGCLGFSYIFINLVELSIFNWIFGQVVFQCIFAFFLYLYYFRSNSNALSIDFIKNFFNESYKFLTITSLVSILCWVLYQSPKVMFSNIFDPSTYGVFMAGFVLAAYVFGALETLVNNFAQTFFYREFDPKSEKHEGAWPLYLYRMLFCFSAIFIIIIPLFDQVAIFIFTNEYLDSRKYLFLGMICEYLRVIGGCFIISGQYIQKPGVNMLPLIASSSFIGISIFIMKFFLDLNLFYIVCVMPIGFVLYLVLANYSTRKYKSLAYDLYVFKMSLLLLITPLFYVIYTSVIYIMPSYEMRLIFDMLLFLSSIFVWSYLFSRELLSGKSIIKSLFSSVD